MRTISHILLFLLLPVTGCIDEHTADPEADPIATGDPLPAFTVTTDSGLTVSHQTLTGYPSVIIFFNTSCGDCRAELPVIQNLYETYGTDGKAAFIAISREQDETSIRNYWKENGLTIPFSAQTDRSVYLLFARSGIPRIYIADANGIVRAVFTDSPLATFDELAHELERLR